MLESATIAAAPRTYKTLATYNDASLLQIMAALQKAPNLKELFDWRNANHEMRARRVLVLLKEYDRMKERKLPMLGGEEAPKAMRTDRGRQRRVAKGTRP